MPQYCLTENYTHTVLYKARIMRESYTKRDPKEYNKARGFFQWLTCRVVYGTYYRVACGLKITGRENVPQDKFFIVASNHVSAIDTFLIVDATGRPVSFKAKT